MFSTVVFKLCTVLYPPTKFQMFGSLQPEHPVLL